MLRKYTSTTDPTTVPYYRVTVHRHHHRPHHHHSHHHAAPLALCTTTVPGKCRNQLNNSVLHKQHHARSGIVAPERRPLIGPPWECDELPECRHCRRKFKWWMKIIFVSFFYYWLNHYFIMVLPRLFQAGSRQAFQLAKRNVMFNRSLATAPVHGKVRYVFTRRHHPALDHQGWLECP